MLVKIGKKNDSDYRPSPFIDEAGKRTVSRNAPPLRLKTIPDKNSGFKVPTGRQLFKMMENPKMREAVDLVEKVYGCETGLKRAVRKQLVKDRVGEMHMAVNKRVIDLSLSKQKFKDAI